MGGEMHVISLGAGVQSSTMALMARHGEITPHPEAAVFADTQNEPKAVYAWLDWLEQQLDFPVYRVTKGDLFEDSTRLRTSRTSGHNYTKHAIPAFIVDPEGHQGLAMRQCTSDHKISVIRRKLRELHGGRPVVQWMGISVDEYRRMKTSAVEWITNRYPLVDMKVTRTACKEWMQRHGYPEPPRSACSFCPYHNNEEWQRLKTQDPEAFARAVAYEKRLQSVMIDVHNFRGTPYLHRSLKPLDQVDFQNEGDPTQLNLFNNECEGMCGV